MADTKVVMSLDDIIKAERKKGGKGKGRPNNQKKGPIAKGKRKNNKQPALPNNAATKKLVQELVNKELAKREKAARRTKTIIKTNGVRRASGGLSQRSRVIKRSPKTETVVVRRVVSKPQQQKPRRVIREVIVEEPVRQRVVTVPANRPRVVYVQKSNAGFQQRQRNFNSNRRRQNADPFYEPRNYLQRI